MMQTYNLIIKILLVSLAILIMYTARAYAGNINADMGVDIQTVVTFLEGTFGVFSEVFFGECLVV